MDGHQASRFRRLFTIVPSSFDNGSMLNKVLDLDPNNRDTEIELTYEDYKEFLHVKIDLFEENYKRLKLNIDIGEKYHFIHSYGKNGKTTFVRRFIHENKSDYDFILMDFKDFQLLDEERHSLLSYIIKRYIRYSKHYKSRFLEVIKECIVHIQKNQLDVEIHSTNDLRDEYNELFSSIGIDFLTFIESIEEEAKKGGPEISDYTAILFQNKFENFIDSLLDRGNVRTVDLLNLLLLSIVKLNYEESKTLIFVFDNIDDILTHAAEYLTAQILPQIDTFFTILNMYLNLNTTFIDEVFLDKISFIFIYRTANYVSSIHSVVHYNLSSAARRDRLLSAPVYVLSSVKETNLIIEKKLKLYGDLCEYYNVTKAPSYKTLLSILKSLQKEDDEYKFMFKLWNGNQYAFLECYKSLSQSNYEHTVLENANLPNRIKGAANIFFIVKYYLDNGNKRVPRDATLVSAFQYAFTNETCDQRECNCNLLRLFLSYIINHNQKLSRPRKYKDNKEIFSRGVSLLSILEALTKFKRDDEFAYRKDDFKELFDRIFHDDIDAFDFFITCVKNTDITDNGIKKLGKKYDFSKELDMFFDNPELDDNQRASLNSIRIYYNTNAKYFLNNLKKHFEFFSSTVPENQHPLSYNIKVYKTTPENDLFADMDYEFGYTFNNDSILKSVFNKTVAQIRTVTDFYLSVVIGVHPPKNYALESNFALNEKFHYAAVISTHIGYIEKVRQNLLNGNLKFKIQDENKADFIDGSNIDQHIKPLADINGRFVFWIENYIDLFTSIYVTIRAVTRDRGFTMDADSGETRHSFKELLKKIKIIKDSDFLDFTTKIETSHERDQKRT